MNSTSRLIQPRALAAALAASVLLAGAFGCGSPAPAGSAPADVVATGDATGSDTAGADAAGADSVTGDTAKPDTTVADATADAAADIATTDASAADATAADAATDAAATAPLPLEQFTEKFIEAICTSLTTCGSKTFSTKQGCVAFMSTQLGQEGEGPGEMVALVKAGKTTYDAVAAGKCLALYTGCGILKNSKPPAECAKVFVGLGLAGAACKEDEECASLYCGKSETQNWECPGKCTAKVASGQACTTDDACDGQLLCILDKCASAGGKVGDACVQGSCGTGLYCDSSAEKNACAAMLDAGKACAGEYACKEGLFCGANSAGDGASCQAPAKIGAACAGNGSGSGGFGSDMFGNAPSPCEGGGICASTATPGKFACLASAALGAACTHAQQCGGLDVECAGLTASAPGKCQPLPAKGQKCSQPDLMKGQLFTCQLPLVCDAKTSLCGDAPVAGQPCLFMCAPGLSCNNGTCLGKAKVGESCESASCQNGLQCENGKCVKAICE